MNADLREQGCAVWDTKLHTIQGCPIEVLLQAPCYHITWEALHMYSSARRTIYLFAAFFPSLCLMSGCTREPEKQSWDQVDGDKGNRE